MRRFSRLLLLSLALTAGPSLAQAADNWSVTGSGGASVGIRSKDTGSGQANFVVPADGTGAAYSPTNPLPADSVVKGTPVNRGSSIATGGTAQQLMAANTARRGWRLQNLSSGDLYVNELGTASAAGDSLKVPAGALYETPPNFVSTGVISVFGAVTGQIFYAREF